MVLGLHDPQLEVILPKPDVCGQWVGGVMIEKLQREILEILGTMLGYSSFG